MAVVETTAGVYDSELSGLRQALGLRLHALGRQVRSRLWLDVAARIVVVLAAAIILSFVIDWQLEPSHIARVICLLLAAAAVVAVAVQSIWDVVRLGLEPIDLAAELDKARRLPPSHWIAPRVATVIQLSGAESRNAGFSPAMVDRAVRLSAQTLDGIDLSRQLDERHARWTLTLIATAVAVPILFFAFLPTDISGLWARRWLMGSNETWPRDTTLEVLDLRDGRLIVPRGEPAWVRVAVRDRRRPTETVWLQLQSADAPAELSTMVKFGSGDFRLELPPLQQPAQAEFRGGDGRIGPVEIEPFDRPRIARLALVSKHPRDKAPRTYLFTGEEANVRLLAKTAAELTVSASIPVSDLDVSADGRSAPRFERVDEQTFRARWTHEAPMQLKIGLTARDSRLASRPQPVGIGFQEDRPPRVTLTHSGVGARVSPMAIIPLKVAVRDDFAVARALLDFHIAPNASATSQSPGDAPRSITIAPLVLLDPKAAAQAETTFDASREWDLLSLKLVPGDAASVTAEASDDCYTGPQSARSRTLAFRVVSPTDLFREILLRQQQLRSRLRKATEQAEALRESLRTAALSKDGEELLKRHLLVQREAWQVMHGIEDSATEMRLNRLGGPETYELILRTVFRPLERLHDDLLTRQRQGFESLRQAAPETQDQLMTRQQQIVDAMQIILKNMGQWDSFIDVVNQLNEVIKLEQAIREKTEELKKKQFDSIFDRK